MDARNNSILGVGPSLSGGASAYFTRHWINLHFDQGFTTNFRDFIEKSFMRRGG